MAATGFTPIQLYYSTTASAQPTAGNLLDGELALNINDMKLYAKNSSGTVTLIASAGGAAGTVQSVSVVAANGFGGTVANPTTTPAITLTTSVTGLLKGNGSAVSAAVSGTDYAPATSGTSLLKGNGSGGFSNASAGTDYAPPTSGTAILYGNGSGGFSNVTIGSGISFAGGTLSSTGSGGTVTSVGMTVPAFLSVSGSPVTGSGTLAVTLSGTALPVANGGTGQTSFTDGQLLIGNSTGNTLAKATLTAGSGITIANGAGSITISASAAGDNSLLWFFMG